MRAERFYGTGEGVRCRVIRQPLPTHVVETSEAVIGHL